MAFTQMPKTWLLFSGIIHDRLRLPGAPSHSFGRSHRAALALESPVGEWSCICICVCAYCSPQMIVNKDEWAFQFATLIELSMHLPKCNPEHISYTLIIRAAIQFHSKTHARVAFEANRHNSNLCSYNGR